MDVRGSNWGAKMASTRRFYLSVIWLVLFQAATLFFAPSCAADGLTLSIRASNRTLAEGQIAAFTVIASHPDGKQIANVPLQPELDGKPWCGPFQTNQYGVCRFVLPMPLVGRHSVNVTSGTTASPSVYLQVTAIRYPVITDPKHLIGMDLETWFGPGYAQWGHQEATPVLGEYSSLDVRVLRQQTLWMNQLGINFVQLDWSNNLGGTWPDAPAREMRDSTNLLCKLYLTMKQHPLIVLLVGPDHGKFGTTQFMKQLNYIYDHYIKNPRYRKLFLDYLGKPLLDVYMGGPTRQSLPKWSSKRFTIRYVNAWLEKMDNVRDGYWSWYDRDPQVTVFRGEPEAMTAVFGYPGYISNPATGNYESPDADGKDYGVTFRNQWQKVMKVKPRFVFVNQWNEFEPPDQWSQNMSNDIEPTLHRGFGNNGHGGWGFEYFLRCREAIRKYQKALGNLVITRKFTH